MVDAPPPEQTHAIELEGHLKILVVEDDQDVAEMMLLALEALGHEPILAGDAREGIAMAREHRPDLVLCDIGLPNDESGHVVAQTLRADADGQRYRLVALTGYGRDRDKEETAAAGFDAHLTKPVDIDVLEAFLARVARGELDRPTSA